KGGERRWVGPLRVTSSDSVLLRRVVIDPFYVMVDIVFLFEAKDGVEYIVNLLLAFRVHQGHGSSRLRGEPVGVNDVTRKRVTDHVAGYGIGARGQGIVDRERL